MSYTNLTLLQSFYTELEKTSGIEDAIARAAFQDELEKLGGLFSAAPRAAGKVIGAIGRFFGRSPATVARPGIRFSSPAVVAPKVVTPTNPAANISVAGSGVTPPKDLGAKPAVPAKAPPAEKYMGGPTEGAPTAPVTPPMGPGGSAGTTAAPKPDKFVRKSGPDGKVVEEIHGANPANAKELLTTPSSAAAPTPLAPGANAAAGVASGQSVSAAPAGGAQPGATPAPAAAPPAGQSWLGRQWSGLGSLAGKAMLGGGLMVGGVGVGAGLGLGSLASGQQPAQRMY